MPMPLEDRLELLVAAVDPPARLADPVDPGDQPLAVGAVLHVEPERPRRDRLELLEVPDDPRPSGPGRSPGGVFEVGMSTTGRSIRMALRIRVSMSAIGSVIMAGSIPTTAAGNAPGPRRGRSAGRAASARRGMSLRVGPRGPVGRPSPARFLDARDQARRWPCCGSRCGRCRTCGRPPGAGRRACSGCGAGPRSSRGRLRLDHLGFGRHAGLTVALRSRAVASDRGSFGPVDIDAARYGSRNGMPKARSSSRASSSLRVW